MGLRGGNTKESVGLESARERKGASEQSIKVGLGWNRAVELKVLCRERRAPVEAEGGDESGEVVLGKRETHWGSGRQVAGGGKRGGAAWEKRGGPTPRKKRTKKTKKKQTKKKNPQHTKKKKKKKKTKNQNHQV